MWVFEVGEAGIVVIAVVEVDIEVVEIMDRRLVCYRLVGEGLGIHLVLMAVGYNCLGVGLGYLCHCSYNLQEKYDCGGITDEEWYKLVDKYNKLILKE